MANPSNKPAALLTRWLWLILPLLVFGALAAAFGLLRIGGSQIPYIILGATLLFGFGWVLISSLHPARADRFCPECGEEALERLDPETTRGVTCASCGHTDRDASSWLLAEEETTLEEIVLRERARVSGVEPEELAHARAEDATHNPETTP